MEKFRLTNNEVWDLRAHAEIMTTYKNYEINIKTLWKQEKMIYYCEIYKIVNGEYLKKEADAIDEIVNFVNEMLKGDKNETTKI